MTRRRLAIGSFYLLVVLPVIITFLTSTIAHATHSKVSPLNLGMLLMMIMNLLPNTWWLSYWYATTKPVVDNDTDHPAFGFVLATIFFWLGMAVFVLVGWMWLLYTKVQDLGGLYQQSR